MQSVRGGRAVAAAAALADAGASGAAKTQDKSSWGNEEYANDIEKVAGANKEHLESAHAMAVEAREVRGRRRGRGNRCSRRRARR